MAHILRVSIFGSMPGGEVWSTNPCWEIAGASGAPVSPAQALTIATALGGVSIPLAFSTAMAPGTTVAGYRVEARDVTGTLESQAEFVRPTASNGTSAIIHPFQTAWVISLRTFGVGARYRGRLYWPATGQALGASDYRVSAANAGAFLAGAKTYLSAMEAVIKATLPDANLTVWSRQYAQFRDISSLQVGNVLDTQRRRRDTLIEAYSSTSYP